MQLYGLSEVSTENILKALPPIKLHESSWMVQTLSSWLFKCMAFNSFQSTACINTDVKIVICLNCRSKDGLVLLVPRSSLQDHIATFSAHRKKIHTIWIQIEHEFGKILRLPSRRFMPATKLGHSWPQFFVRSSQQPEYVYKLLYLRISNKKCLQIT